MKTWVMASVMVLALAAGAESQELDFLVSPGPLSGVHSDLSGLTNCVSCHSPGKGIEANRCLACHKDLAERTAAGRGFHRDKVSDCIGCHAEHQGEGFQLVRWNSAEFDHAESGYPLQGLHRDVSECQECHKASNAPPRTKSQTYLLNDSSCVACHADVHKGQLGEDCQRCHSVEVKFKQVGFQHERTAFPLEGAHRKVRCQQCHPNQKWKGLRFSRCTDCHQDTHRPSLGSDCERCHNVSSWVVSTFDHERTKYPLRGMHRPLTCSKCHVGQRFKGASFSLCTDCHRDDPHWGQFDTDCSTCHVVDGFKRWTGNHDATRYPLTGKHVAIDCVKCHRMQDAQFPSGLATAIRYKPLETLCASCHQDIHLGQLTESCEACHGTIGFGREALDFEHNEDSPFKLMGRHTSVACAECHPREKALFPTGEGETVRYRPLSDQCAACHVNIHDPSWWRTRTVALESDCQSCHSQETFVVESFDHNQTTLALDGGHTTLTCNKCHALASWQDRNVLVFQELGRDCADCHHSPHSKRMAQCLACHTTSNWRVKVW